MKNEFSSHMLTFIPEIHSIRKAGANKTRKVFETILPAMEAQSDSIGRDELESEETLHATHELQETFINSLNTSSIATSYVELPFDCSHGFLDFHTGSINVICWRQQTDELQSSLEPTINYVKLEGSSQRG